MNITVIIIIFAPLFVMGVAMTFATIAFEFDSKTTFASASITIISAIISLSFISIDTNSDVWDIKGDSTKIEKIIQKDEEYYVLAENGQEYLMEDESFRINRNNDTYKDCVLTNIDYTHKRHPSLYKHFSSDYRIYVDEETYNKINNITEIDYPLSNTVLGEKEK